MFKKVLTPDCSDNVHAGWQKSLGLLCICMCLNGLSCMALTKCPRKIWTSGLHYCHNVKQKHPIADNNKVLDHGYYEIWPNVNGDLKLWKVRCVSCKINLAHLLLFHHEVSNLLMYEMYESHFKHMHANSYFHKSSSSWLYKLYKENISLKCLVMRRLDQTIPSASTLTHPYS